MKISNETKIGVLTALAITIMILGFNFLKGKTFFGSSHTLYAKYTNVQGLAASNPVMINGLQVGTVYSISTDKNMKTILVNMTLTKDVNIPTNSFAVIRNNPLGTTNVDIKLGDANEYLAKNDTIKTEVNGGILDAAIQEVKPVLAQVKNAVKSLDSVLMSLNSVIDPHAKNNIREILDNLNKTTAGLTVSSASLQTLLNTQTGALAKSLNNISSFTGNLANNNDKLTSTLTNLDKTATNLSNLDLQKTLTTLDATVTDLKSSLGKLNTTNGTAGMLLNDPKLYNNLAATANKLNVLIDDIKTNPKRYLSISVFGKKNKSNGLAVPLPDTLHAPYLVLPNK
jgi:phospholipid/cholesterol/gamma-HCH transport system substrate-binding protein